MSNIPRPLQSMNDFLSIRDLESAQLLELIDFCIRRKAAFKEGTLKPTMQGRTLAMIFQKSSLRTRMAFEVAMAQLGGHAVNLEDHQIGIGRREAVSDVARVISSMCDIITARVMKHQFIVELAAHSTIPVINALSDWSHPCQAIADLMTVQEHFGSDLSRLKMAYVGDANNVARSLLNACAKLNIAFAIAAPAGYQFEHAFFESARSWQGEQCSDIILTDKPAEAVNDADIVYTDVWTSMGQEAEHAEREKAFAGYQVNADMMKHAKPEAVVMHCLPAHRNEEISSDMVDGPQSIIFHQAENRLHSQRAMLEILLTNAGKAG